MNIKKLFIGLLSLLCASNLFASNYASQASGYFDKDTTWTNLATGASAWPCVSNDSWYINPPHVINYTNFTGNSASGDSIIYTNCKIYGTFQMTQACRIAFGGPAASLVGTGVWSIGSATLPINYDAVGYDGTNSPVTIALYHGDISAWIMDATRSQGIKWYGNARTNIYSFLSERAGIGTNIIHLKTPIDCRTGDVICVTKQAISSGATYHQIAGITNLDLYYSSSSANNWGFGYDFPTNQIYSTNLISSRSADITGVILITGQPISVVKRANRNIFFNNLMNGIFQGVRFDGAGPVVYTGPTNRFTECSFHHGGHASQGFVATSVAGAMFNRCVIAGELSGGAFGYGVNQTFTNCVVVNTTYALGAAGSATSSDFHAFDCVSFNNYYAFLNSLGPRVYFRNCSVYSAATAWNYYPWYGWNYFYNCLIRDSGGGFSYLDTTGTCMFENCTSISNIDSHVSNTAYPTRFINFTTIGTVPNLKYSPSDYINWRDYVLITNTNLLSFYFWGGWCVSQSGVSAPASVKYTMGHFSTNGTALTYPHGWTEEAVVRPYGSARWTVYLQRKNLAVEQLAVIRKRGTPWPFHMDDRSLWLAAATNTQVTNTWQTSDLVYNNTNNYSVDVTMGIFTTGDFGTNGYSAAVKHKDEVIRMMTP